MRKRGQKKWLEPEGLVLIEGWARDGVSEEEIAERCGISRDTLLRWRVKHPCFDNAIRFGREATDYLVEQALLKRATGYDYAEETWELKPNKETGQNELQLTKKQLKHQQADVGAQQFWLKKRKKNVWGEASDSAEENRGGDTGVAVVPEILKDDDAGGDKA